MNYAEIYGRMRIEGVREGGEKTKKLALLAFQQINVLTKIKWVKLATLKKGRKIISA